MLSWIADDADTEMIGSANKGKESGTKSRLMAAWMPPSSLHGCIHGDSALVLTPALQAYMRLFVRATTNCEKPNPNFEAWLPVLRPTRHDIQRSSADHRHRGQSVDRIDDSRVASEPHTRTKGELVRG